MGMVSEGRRDYLDYLWGEETSDPETWEWRDDLDAEALATVLHSIYEPDKEPSLLTQFPILKKWRMKK